MFRTIKSVLKRYLYERFCPYLSAGFLPLIHNILAVAKEFNNLIVCVSSEFVNIYIYTYNFICISDKVTKKKSADL